MSARDSSEAALLRSAYWIAGPTASGKSRFALELAEAVRGEIISVDSMQVYRGMDIGTAKPTSQEQERVPHHMIDLVDIHEAFDVARYRREALEAARSIRQRGKVIIFCGGTGFYIQALIQGIGTGPPSDPALRSELNTHSLESLVAALQEEDPPTHASIDRHNKRKIVRALEVVRLTGKSFTSFKSDWSASPHVDLSKFWVLEWASDTLRRRIDQRVDVMMQDGWVGETRRLIEQGLRENTTACQAIGYRQIMDHLDDRLSLAEAIELIKTKTWQFAKRQRTWFRHQVRGQSLPLDEASSEKVISEEVQSISRRIRDGCQQGC